MQKQKDSSVLHILLAHMKSSLFVYNVMVSCHANIVGV